MKNVTLGSTLGLALILSACGQSNQATLDAQSVRMSAAPSNGERYTARLRPLNASVNQRGVTGEATFSTSGGMFSAAVDARNLTPGLHVMHIHAFDECPTAESDTNGDNLVDVIEGVPYYGPILIPLDDDLSSQANGNFTHAGANGKLSYSASASLDVMLADLHAPDPNLNDAVVKLAGNEELNLAGRHVVIHGVSADAHLPDSVQSIGSIPAQVTLPVACGEISHAR